MNVGRIFTKLQKAFDLVTLKSKASYSQSGEDLIIDYFFESIGIKQPAYIDIGANHPEKGNNTYLFYLKGSRGICIEPDITLIPALKKVRPRDLVLNLGISIEAEDFADFYFFKEHHHAWNTFSKADAVKKSEESGLPFYSTKVKLDTIKNITQKYQFEKVNYLSIDVEGLDLEILKSIDFGWLKPELICVETIAFSMTNTLQKNQETVDYMLSKDYLVYADTNLNTIFCRKDLFK
jgi:FkbM family methyltransferase